jgi:hypothetical protein
MVLEIALILVAMIVLAALELRLSWSLGESDDRRRRHEGRAVSRVTTRLVAWRRRYLNARTIPALIVLVCLLAPGLAAIVLAAV